jgi:hypothetical protein
MQEELLTENIVFTDILILQVGMRLFKDFEIPILIMLRDISIVLSLLLPELEHIIIDLEHNQFQIPGEDLCPLPEVIVVPQINEQVDNFLLGLLPLFTFFNEKHDEMFIKCTVAGVDAAVKLGGMLDAVVVDVE